MKKIITVKDYLKMAINKLENSKNPDIELINSLKEQLKRFAQ